MTSDKKMTRQKIRHIEYDRVYVDVQEEVNDEDGSREYIDQLGTDYSDSASYETLIDVFAELSSRFHDDDDHTYAYEEMPYLLISKAFKDGFLLGLEVNRRLIGADFDRETNRYLVELIDDSLSDADLNIVKATETIRSIGGTTFTNNFANKGEIGAHKFKGMHNPLDNVVDFVTSELYAKDDELQNSLFEEGFGIARLSQLKHQQKIDRRFGRLIATIQPIDSE